MGSRVRGFEDKKRPRAAAGPVSERVQAGLCGQQLPRTGCHFVIDNGRAVLNVRMIDVPSSRLQGVSRTVKKPPNVPAIRRVFLHAALIPVCNSAA